MSQHNRPTWDGREVFSVRYPYPCEKFELVVLYIVFLFSMRSQAARLSVTIIDK